LSTHTNAKMFSFDTNAYMVIFVTLMVCILKFRIKNAATDRKRLQTKQLDTKAKHKQQHHSNRSARNKLAHCPLFISVSINFKRFLNKQINRRQIKTIHNQVTTPSTPLSKFMPTIFLTKIILNKNRFHMFGGPLRTCHPL